MIQRIFCLLLLFGSFSYAVEHKNVTVQADTLVELEVSSPAVWIAQQPFTLQVRSYNHVETEGAAIKYVCVFWSGSIPVNESTGRRTAVIDAFSNGLVVPDFTRFVITVEGGPTPPPDPDPPDPDPPAWDCSGVPDDAFDNIGKRCCEWVQLVEPDGRDRALPLSKLYLDVAAKMASGELIEISDAQQYLKDNLPAAFNGEQAKWTKFVDELRNDLGNRDMDRIQLRQYYEAMGKGLASGAKNALREDVDWLRQHSAIADERNEV